MPRIRLTRSGLNIEGATRARGEEVDVPAEVAAYLIPSGQAVPVRGAPVEAEVVGPVETTSVRPRRVKGVDRASAADRV
jgi:hypothetical protein